MGDVKPEEVHAKYEDGILKLSVPKVEEQAVDNPKLHCH